MPRPQQTVPPRRPMTVASCLVSILVLLLILASLSGFVLFFFRVVLPRIPRRIVPNPESYQGVGEQLTYLELDPLTGHPPRLSLPDLDHHVVLINFWGTWCPPCRAELPKIAALQERFAGHEKFRLVAISYPALGREDDLTSLRENTEALLKRLDLDLPTYWDPDNATRSAIDWLIPDAVDATASDPLFPLTVLLGRHGVLRAVWVGYRPGVETEIERYVDQVLSEERTQ